MKCNETNYIKRLKNQKDDALEYIVDKYIPLVKGTIYKILSPLKNEGILEECINDVFISVWSNSDKFNGSNDDFKKWIYAIAKFKAIDYYRKEIKQINKDIKINTPFNNLLEDEIIAIENKHELMMAIDSLDKMDKEIIIMKFFLGFKSQDIARKFNVTKSSIDNKIYRIKKKLKDILECITLEVI